MRAPAALCAFALLLAAAVINSLLQMIQRGFVATRGKDETKRRTLWFGALILALLAVAGNSCSALALEVLAPATVSAVLRGEVLVVGTMET